MASIHTTRNENYTTSIGTYMSPSFPVERDVTHGQGNHEKMPRIYSENPDKKSKKKHQRELYNSNYIIRKCLGGAGKASNKNSKPM